MFDVSSVFISFSKHKSVNFLSSHESHETETNGIQSENNIDIYW